MSGFHTTRAGAVVCAGVRASTWQQAGRRHVVAALKPRVNTFRPSMANLHPPPSCIDIGQRSAERQGASVDIRWVDAKLRGAPGSLGWW
jgi:hypothetical protein